MDLRERIKKAKELLGDDIHIVGAEEKRRKKALGRFRKLGGFRHSRHPEMDRAQYYSCARKRPYKSQSEARKYANRLEQVRSKKLRVYFCEICQRWHLTSKPLNKYSP